jgi:hypothetical protein
VAWNRFEGAWHSREVCHEADGWEERRVRHPGLVRVDVNRDKAHLNGLHEVVGGAPKPAANGDLFKHFPRGTVNINKKMHPKKTASWPTSWAWLLVCEEIPPLPFPHSPVSSLNLHPGTQGERSLPRRTPE